jgi:hypothetical protein
VGNNERRLDHKTAKRIVWTMSGPLERPRATKSTPGTIRSLLVIVNLKPKLIVIQNKNKNK